MENRVGSQGLNRVHGNTLAAILTSHSSRFFLFTPITYKVSSFSTSMSVLVFFVVVVILVIVFLMGVEWYCGFDVLFFFFLVIKRY